MPYQIKKPCSYPGCPELIEPGESYCKKHKPVVNSQRHRLYDEKQRDLKSARFYNSAAWKKLRIFKLSRDPLCEYCLEKDHVNIATEVDHVIPIKVDWSMRLVFNNLNSTCHRCHMIKTKGDKKKYGS